MTTFNTSQLYVVVLEDEKYPEQVFTSQAEALANCACLNNQPRIISSSDKVNFKVRTLQEHIEAVSEKAYNDGVFQESWNSIR